MKRSDLIERMSEKWDRSERETRLLIDTFFQSIGDILKREGRLELRGFGVFEVKQRDSRPGRIPGTGETVDVPAHAVPDFSPGKSLKNQVRALKSHEVSHQP